MAKKQTEVKAVKETVLPVKKAAPRVRTSKHRAASIPMPQEEPLRKVQQEIVARIAYGYWEARGFRDGDPLQDWLMAEAEIRRRAQ
jgi:hypothetical protein